MLFCWQTLIVTSSVSCEPSRRTVFIVVPAWFSSAWTSSQSWDESTAGSRYPVVWRSCGDNDEIREFFISNCVL